MGSRRALNGDCRMDKAWFVFLFSWNLWIHCFNLFSVCTYHSFQELHWRDPFTVPEDASYDFTRRSLHLEFVPLHPPSRPSLAPPPPPDLLLFCPRRDAPRGRRFADDEERKHSMREEFRRFIKDRHTVPHARWKTSVDNEGKFVKELSQHCKECTHDVCKFNYNFNYSFWGKKSAALLLYRPSHICSTVSAVSVDCLHNPCFYIRATAISIRYKLYRRVSWTVNIYTRILLHSLNVIKTLIYPSCSSFVI
jgi:hypothetical protein